MYSLTDQLLALSKQKILEMQGFNTYRFRWTFTTDVIEQKNLDYESLVYIWVYIYEECKYMSDKNFIILKCILFFCQRMEFKAAQQASKIENETLKQQVFR